MKDAIRVIRMALCGVALAAAMTAVAGCATTEPTTSVSAWDQQLAQAVQDRIDADPMIPRGSVHATSSGGLVVLSGVVEDESQRRRAVSVARGTPGVLSVSDRLRVF